MAFLEIKLFFGAQLILPWYIRTLKVLLKGTGVVIEHKIKFNTFGDQNMIKFERQNEYMKYVTENDNMDLKKNSGLKTIKYDNAVWIVKMSLFARMFTKIYYTEFRRIRVKGRKD